MGSTFLTFFVTLFVGLTALAADPRCEGIFLPIHRLQVPVPTHETLREMARLRVDADLHPSKEMREFLTKVFESKLRELLTHQDQVPQILKDLRRFIVEARAEELEKDQSTESRKKSEKEILERKNLKVRHKYDIPISPLEFGNFNGNGRGSIHNGLNPPDPLYSGEGILFSRNERFAMIRPVHVHGRATKTIILDLKKRKRLRYTPGRGLFSQTSDYYAEVHEGDLIRVVDVLTKKVIGTAKGDPLWPDSRNFTNDFIITGNRDKTQPARYTLNSFQSGTLDLGTAFAIGTNEQILFVQDHKIKCVNGKTLSEVPLPPDLQDLTVEAVNGYSRVLTVMVGSEKLRIVAQDFSYYRESEFPSAQLFADRFIVQEDKKANPPRAKIFDLSTRRQIEIEGTFIYFEDRAGIMVFHTQGQNETILLEVSNFESETFPGKWEKLTSDGAYLLQNGRRLEHSKLVSVKDRVEEKFEILGSVRYLPRQGIWILSVELPKFKGHKQIVIESPRSTDDTELIADHYYIGLSSSGRYLTVGNQGKVQLLELADPTDLIPSN